MQVLIVILHVVICFALIIIVLLQKGKGASMGAAFGGSTQTVFGGAGPTSFLSKLTTAAAVVFMLTSLFLSIMFSRGKSVSIMEGVKTKPPVTQEQSVPAKQSTSTPAPAPAKTNQANKK